VKRRNPNTCATGIRLALRSSLRLRPVLQIFLLMSACLLAACSSQPSVMAMFFDIPPPGQDKSHDPVIRGPRRTVFVDPAIEEAKAYLARLQERAKAPPPANWTEIYKKLPKDDDANIDWMAALKDKIITPRGAIDPKTPDEGKTTDDDIKLSTSGKPARMVIFSHAVHTQWLTCTNCHPAIFKKDAGSAKITMDAIDNGKYCGVCHDKVAIAQPSGCKGCHRVKKKKS